MTSMLFLSAHLELLNFGSHLYSQRKLTDKVGKIENVDYVAIIISFQTLLGKHVV